jgi:hypothetical protein
MQQHDAALLAVHGACPDQRCQTRRHGGADEEALSRRKATERDVLRRCTMIIDVMNVRRASVYRGSAASPARAGVALSLRALAFRWPPPRDAHHVHAARHACRDGRGDGL